MRKGTILRALGEELRQRRLALKLSQEALAHLAGVHTNVIGRLERGRYNPSVLTIQSIATKLDVPLHKLFEVAES